MSVIERINQLLIDAGVPKRQVRRVLAATCKVSVQAVGDWYNGNTRRISPEYIAKIAGKYGTTADYLITGKGRRGTGDRELDALLQAALEDDPENLKNLLRAYVRESS